VVLEAVASREGFAPPPEHAGATTTAISPITTANLRTGPKPRHHFGRTTSAEK
jgi:hypothetical protein